MKFFVDSADLEILSELSQTGMVDGVTTNPSLIAKSKSDFFTVIRDICKIIEGPVSAEVVAVDMKQMIYEGEKLSAIAPNVVVKLPLTMDGLKTCKYLTDKNIPVNVTLCFSVSQALMAAKAGATYISPFVGRLDDIGQNGLQLIEDICKMYKNYPGIKTEVIVASVRSNLHIMQSALYGAHIATIPPQLFQALIAHPLTDKGLQTFLDDWKKTGQIIK